MKVILVLMLTINCLHAKYWTTKKSTSYELQALVESFKMDYMTEEEKKSLQEKIENLDSLLSALSKEEHFFISKTAVYKWLLKNKPNIRIPNKFVIENFQSKSEPGDLAPFPKWLLTALRSDTAEIVADKNYERYRTLLNKEPQKAAKSKLHKKIAMIRPWLYLFQKEDAQQIDLRMMKFHFTILEHIIAQFKIFSLFKSDKLPTPSQSLSFFVFREKGKPITEDKTLSILEEVIQKHKNAGLPVPTNDWSLPEEDSWDLSKNDEKLSKQQEVNIKNPTPKKDYRAPQKLPEPIDDWVWD